MITIFIPGKTPIFIPTPPPASDSHVAFDWPFSGSTTLLGLFILVVGAILVWAAFSKA